MELPTPRSIAKFFLVQPIVVSKTLKFVIEKGHAGADTLFTSLFKAINHSLADQISDSTITSLAGLATKTTTGFAALAVSVGIYENQRSFVELLGLDGYVDSAASYVLSVFQG